MAGRRTGDPGGARRPPAPTLLLLTEWHQFAQIDWLAVAAVAAVMRRPAWLFDARVKADGPAARASGLQVWTVGDVSS